MSSPCDPPKFHQQDFSQFDFSRWHLDGVQLDPTAAAIANLTTQLFNSAEWVQSVQTTLPEVQKQALVFYQESSRQLQAEKEATASDFERRTVAARNQSASLALANDAAAAPLVVQPSADTYHVAIKVTDSSGHLGLPGLVAQLMDPRNPDVPLAQAATDEDGNAVLSIPAATSKELDTLHTAVRVVDPSGKVLQRVADGACIRLNQTETRVIPLNDSPEIQPAKDAALAARSQRAAQAQRIGAKIDLLPQERDTRLKALDCKIQQNQAIIDSIQQPPPTGTSQPPSGGPQTPPPTSQPGTAPQTGSGAAPAAGTGPAATGQPAPGKQPDAKSQTPPAADAPPARPKPPASKKGDKGNQG
jgi:hypothetical protein